MKITVSTKKLVAVFISELFVYRVPLTLSTGRQVGKSVQLAMMYGMGKK